MQRRLIPHYLLISFFLVCIDPLLAQNLGTVQKPVVKSDWWQIASNPDLGKCTTEKQQPVDFGIWQAEDGTWQLWSCIRYTSCGEHTRLFYRWEGKSLTDTHWEPKGVAMVADTAFGELSGGLQAPYVFREGDIWYMYYGGWARICLATSKDGKYFERWKNEEGRPILFEGPYINTRDPMVFRENGLYYCYYMGHTEGDGSVYENGQKIKKDYKSAIFCRISADKFNWSEPILVSAGGTVTEKTNWYGGDAECPFVLKKDGYYYLFRNQLYGENHLNTQYASKNLFDFGVGNDNYMIGELSVAAPEIIFYQGEYYIASLNPGLDGIRMSKLDWD